MIESILVQGYRSVRHVRLPLHPRVTVVLGENGTGKSNLYRALQLFQHAAAGTLSRAITGEGGMASALWAGDRKRGARARVVIEATMDDLSYEVQLGVSGGDAKLSVFTLDPEVKIERTSLGGIVIGERDGQTATLRDQDGRPVMYPAALWPGESVLSQIADPERFPSLPALRDRFLHWRFYHHFPVDEHAPARRAMVAVRTPALAADGHDLPSALRTIFEIGDDQRLADAVERAFPGCRLELDGRTVHLHTPGLHRPLAAHELSDGTLRYLCLLAALMSPRPPGLLAFNEPESSLHPDLLVPLAELMVAVPEPCQVWLTTHSIDLAQAIEERVGTTAVQLRRRDGATEVCGQGLLDQ